MEKKKKEERESFKESGVSVREIEEFTKKHRFEVVICLMFFLIAIFGSFGTFGPRFNLYSLCIGGMLGVFVLDKFDHLLHSFFKFIFKQEKVVQIILAVSILLLTVVFTFIPVFLLGFLGGKLLYKHLMETSS